MPKRRRPSGRGGGCSAKRPRRHLYLVLDDWAWGYSIREVDLSSGSGSDLRRPQSAVGSSCRRCTGRRDGPHRRGEQSLPPPSFHVEAPRESPAHFVAAPGSKIVAIHPRDAKKNPYAAQPLPPYAPYTVFDVRTRTLGFGRRPETNPAESNLPLYIPAGDGLFSLGYRASRLLRPWPPAPGQCSAAPTLRALPCLPPAINFVLSYAVHPDGRTIFVSVGGYCPNATLSFRMPEEREAEEEGLAGWKPRGDWLLPSSGGGYLPAHFDGELNAWVGIRCDRDQDGYGHVCAADVVPADPDDAGSDGQPPPARRLSKEMLLSEDPAEEPVGGLLYVGGESRFCLLESVENRESATELQDHEVQDAPFLFRVTTFSLKLDENGDLTTGNSRRIRYYSVPEGTSKNFVLWNPVAFWM